MADERILVVDDGADMRDFVIRYVLQPGGYDYREAEDGLAALDLIAADPPDLILLDLQMPRLDGIGLLRRMSEQQINIPVVLMTFYGSEEIAIEVFRLGVRDYVIKPFTEDELLQAIERALTLSRLKQERDLLTERLLQLNRDLEQRLGEFEALFRIGRVVASLSDEDTLIMRLLEATMYLSSSRAAELVLLNETGDLLVSRAVHMEGAVQLVNQVVDHPQAWNAIHEREPISARPYVDDATGDSLVQICVPLVAGNIPLGVLVVVTLEELATRHQLNVLSALADYAATGLERARLTGRVDEIDE